jgi:quercetin dioxygenase-like cupin family protein
MKSTLPTPEPEPAIDVDMAQLFDHTLASPLPDAAPGLAKDGLRERLSARAAASRSAEAAMITTRLRRAVAAPLAAGITQRLLYQAATGAARRPGEPLRVRLIDLDAGSMLHAGLLGPEAELRARHREWLVLAGELRGDREALAARDYHVSPAGQATPTWTAHAATRLFLRESDVAAAPGDAPFTVRDADADWPGYAPGIQRRVLWQRDGMAAMLYRGQPGIAVPQHTHGHDEDCLMVEGELFLDDQLLQAGDYQLAPAGTGHRITATDVGAVIYAHGDLDLRFVG